MTNVMTIKTGAKGIDYQARKSPAELTALRKQGYEFVIRYMNQGFTIAERNDILNAGFGLLLTYEADPLRPLSGYKGGLADGLVMAKLADQFGYPNPVSVITGCDYNVTRYNQQVSAEYMHGVRSSIPHYRYTGAYGDSELLNAIASFNTLNWLPAAFGWNSSPLRVKLHIQQHLYSAAFDTDTAADFFYAMGK